MLNLVTNRASKTVIYDHEDWNRVEAATACLAGLLTDAGYPVTITTKTDWEQTDRPWDAEMARYLANVQKCVDQFCKMPGSPDLPASMDYLTHTGANTIEQTLLDINMLIGNMEKALRYSGTFYAGDISGLRGNAM